MVYQRPLKQRMGLHDKKPTNFNEDSIEWVWRWENMYMYKYVPIKPFELWTKSVHSSINRYGNFIIFDDVMTPFDKICHNLWLMFSVLRDDRNHTNLHHWELYLFINRVPYVADFKQCPEESQTWTILYQYYMQLLEIWHLPQWFSKNLTELQKTSNSFIIFYVHI